MRVCITVQWNPVDTDTDGTCHSVRIDRVSVVSRLILEKIFELFFVGTNETTRYIRVSVERCSTVPSLSTTTLGRMCHGNKILVINFKTFIISRKVSTQNIEYKTKFAFASFSSLPPGQATVEMGWGYLRKQLREFTLNTQVL